MFVKITNIPKPFSATLQGLPDRTGIYQATEVGFGRAEISSSVRRLHKARPGTVCPSLRHKSVLSVAINANWFGAQLNEIRNGPRTQQYPLAGIEYEEVRLFL